MIMHACLEIFAVENAMIASHLTMPNRVGTAAAGRRHVSILVVERIEQAIDARGQRDGNRTVRVGLGDATAQRRWHGE